MSILKLRLKLLTALLALIPTIAAQASVSVSKNKVYVGSVCFPDSLTYPYAITLMDDSVSVVTKNFAGQDFSIQTDRKVTSVKFASLGFDTQYVSITKATADTVSVATIFPEETLHQLNEVVVTAKKAIVKSKGMNYTISNIRGSYIGNAGNLLDMLSWTPGVSVTNDESISVLGRGNPLIYVNGVKILDQSELHSLTSSNVDKVEIIREPGAEYPVGTSSVILITTSKPLSEMVNGEVSENAVFRRAFSDKLRASTFGRVKRVSFNASLTYGLNQSRQNSDYQLNATSAVPDEYRSQTLSQFSKTKNNSVLWFVGANYVTKNKSTFQLQYSGSHGDNKDLYNTLRSIDSQSSAQTEHYTTNSQSSPTKHNVLGSGSLRIYGGLLKLTATYNHLSNTTDDKYVISDVNRTQISDYNYRYNMVTVQGDYSHKIPSVGKQAFGFYLGYTDNYMHLDNTATNQDVTGNNKWAEAYYSLKVEHDKLGIEAGLRGRYEYDTSKEDESEKKTLSYTNLSPKASVTYSISNDYILSASYALFYDLPTFRQINPALRLSNLIFYSKGNPDLKQAYTNRFNITANIKQLTIMTEYYDCHNNIFNVTEPYTNGTFLRHPDNMNRTSDFLLATEYTAMPNSRTRIYGRLLGIRSNLQYVYNSELIKSIGYTMELDINAAYRLGAFSIFLNGRYNTPQKVDTRRLAYRLALNVGADCTLLKNKLYLRLEAQDIFNKSMTPSWEEYSPLLYQHRINKYDTRGVAFTLRYKFTSAKTGFKQASNAADAERLE